MQKEKERRDTRRALKGGKNKRKKGTEGNEKCLKEGQKLSGWMEGKERTKEREAWKLERRGWRRGKQRERQRKTSS